MQGNLFVISGPSGAGKGTLVAKLVEAVPETWFSISATTRKPRDGEAEGVHYYFKEPGEFEELIRNEGLLEWAEYAGNRYGTPKETVLQKIAEGRQVILEIDLQGALQVKRIYPEAHTVFIMPPSLEELRARLTGRGTETPEQIERRLEQANLEISRESEYDYTLINDTVENASRKLIEYVRSFAGESKE